MDDTDRSLLRSIRYAPKIIDARDLFDRLTVLEQDDYCRLVDREYAKPIWTITAKGVYAVDHPEKP